MNENFVELQLGIILLSWLWMFTGGLQCICQRLRGIIHNATYVVSWVDWVTGIVTVGLMFVYGLIV